MKYSHFIQLTTVAGILFCNYLCQATFGINAFKLFYWWIRESPDRGIAVFLVGLCGFVFAGMLAFRCQNIYVAGTGTPEYFIFLGDRLEKGFYGYKIDDATRTRVFIPSTMDATVYPAASFNSLYTQTGMLRDKQGGFLKLNFLWVPNLILWSIINLSMFMFSLCGILMVLKNYAMKFPPASASLEKISGTGISGIYSYVSERTGALQLVIYGMICFYCCSVIVIWLFVRGIAAPIEKPVRLPAHIKPGAELRGKIIDEIAFSVSNTTKSRNASSDTKFYRRFAIEFAEGFDPPVVINFRLLKDDPAAEDLKKAFTDGSLVEIVLDEDLAVETEDWDFSNRILR